MARHVALLATIVLVSFSSATLAQDADQSRNRGACRDDARKLCAGIGRSSGRGAVLDCLASQKDKLSDSCRKSVESRGK
jgi:cysteine rich repeat protein